MKIRFDKNKIVVIHSLCFDAFYKFENCKEYFTSERKALERYGFSDGENEKESIFTGSLIQLARFITTNNIEKKLDNTISKYSISELSKIRNYLIEHYQDILNAPFDKKHKYYNFKDYKIRLVRSLLSPYLYASHKELDLKLATEFRQIWDFEERALNEYREDVYQKALPILKERQLKEFLNSYCCENSCYVKDDIKCEKCFYFSQKPKTNLLNLKENYRMKLRVN